MNEIPHAQSPLALHPPAGPRRDTDPPLFARVRSWVGQILIRAGCAIAPTHHDDRAAEKLFLASRTLEEFHKLTDSELADILLVVLWPDLPMASPKSALVESAIERLKRCDLGPYEG